jgi:glycosyltransferase involved in cell wall biosynthesis
LAQYFSKSSVSDVREIRVVRSQERERDQNLISTTHAWPTIQVIIPTLNEEESIGGVIDKVTSLELNALVSVIVIDGGSTDSTLDICRRKKVNTIIQRGRGKGNAMREAVHLSSAEYVVFIDGDGTYSVDDLPALLSPLLEGKADMVVGSRNRDKMQKGSIDRLNMLGNNIFNRSINFAMRSAVTDSLSGYRALRREIFNELVLFSDRFEIEVEITVEAIAKGFRILEVPITYKVRNGSKTKLDPISDGSNIARSLLFILMNVNPLKFFGLISLIFFASAMYPAYFVIVEKFTTGEVVSIPSVLLSSLLFVSAVMSVVVGLLSELVVRSRRRLEYMINKK